MSATRGLWGRDLDQRGDRRVKAGSPPTALSPQGPLTRWAPRSCALEWVESSGLGWRPQAPPHQPWIASDPPLLGACLERWRRAGETGAPS